MGWLRNLTGIVVINNVEDEPDTMPIENKKKKPKKEPEEEKIPEPAAEEDPFYKTTAKEITWKDYLLYNKWAQLVHVLLLCLFLGLLLPFILTSTAFKPHEKGLELRGYCFINDSVRFACLSYENLTESECEEANCCYQVPDDPFSEMPWCYHSVPSEYGYEVFNASSTPSYASYYAPISDNTTEQKEVTRAHFKLENSDSLAFNLNALLPQTQYGGDFWPVQVLIERGGDDLLRITLSSPDHEEGTLIKDSTFTPSPATAPQLDVEVIQDVGGAFNLTVHRTDNPDQIVFQTMFGPFVMGDGYLEFTTTMPSNRVFGLGGRYSEFASPQFEQFEEWTLNSLDTSFLNYSMPDSHPFYIGIEQPSGIAHGVYLRSSAPLRISSVPAPGLSYKTLLGTFKIIVMAGPRPQDVSQQYASVVGFPSFLPYWAFGFHMCRTVKEEDRSEAFRIATEGMQGYLPFEGDCLDARLSYPDTYSDLSDWATSAIGVLHDAGRKFYLPNYPFVTTDSEAYSEVKKAGYLIKLPGSVEYFGSVSGASVGYPDYMDENSFGSWLSSSKNVIDTVTLGDALFLLQNSPLNEATMSYSLNSGNTYVNCTQDNPKFCCNVPPYIFDVDPLHGVISNGTICWETIHSSMDQSKHLAHHNSYGLYHSERMHSLLKQIAPEKRPVILSSSTHPGSGAFGGQFSEGFGFSLSEQKRALQTVINSGAAGIPFAGVPACGTRDEPENEYITESRLYDLCTRSYQMSIFFPFFVSHYELDQIPRNPPNVRDGFVTQMKPYVLLRYSLLPTIYTLAEQAARLGTPIIRPMAYEFPEDENAGDISFQFMMGSSLMVVPNFENSTEVAATVNVPVYLPPGQWYNFFTGNVKTNDENGTFTYLPTVSTDVNVLIRGGQAVFLQGNLHEVVNNAEEHRTKTYTVIMTLPDDNSTAEGYMYYDDGETLTSSPTYAATLVTAMLSNTTQTFSLTRGPLAWDSEVLLYCNASHNSMVDVIQLYGLGLVDKVMRGNNETDFSQDIHTSMAVHIENVQYDWCATNAASSVEFSWTYV